MALIGEIPVFYSGSSDWSVYTERLEQFFEINDIAAEKKKALLITSIGEDVYKTLRDVCHPVLPKGKTYDELIALLNKQFCIKTSVFRERVKFYTARQYPNETISLWFARIKKLSVDCKFGDQFETVLLDRFISGLRPTPVLDRLCEEDSGLTLQQAVDIALNKESAVPASTEEGDDNQRDGGFRQRGNYRRYNNCNRNKKAQKADEHDE